jgi:hypothetical protein
MKRLKYPEQFRSVINFHAGTTDMIAETPDERQVRLRRQSNRRRAAAFAKPRQVSEARWEAITEAWRRVYDGAAFPIHFDLVLTSAGYTRTERYSLMDAAFTSGVADGKILVGSKGGVRIRSGRSEVVLAHFVHTVNL